jgi:hypothetical protein
MKNSTTLAFTHAVVCLALLPVAHAQTGQSETREAAAMERIEGQPSGAEQQPKSKPFTGQSSESDRPQAAQSFVGTIMKSGDSYVLKTIDQGTYRLDDQPRAQKFCGKVVEVTGNLDAPHNTIRVQEIKAGG